MSPPSKYPDATFQAAARMREAGRTWEEINQALCVPNHFRQCFTAWQRRNEGAA